MDTACAVRYPPEAHRSKMLTTPLPEVTVIKPRAWERVGKETIFALKEEKVCQEPKRDFSIPESLTKENCIFKSYLRA